MTDRQPERISAMTKAQVKHMVDRFLGWRLPEDFRPDGGVQFDADGAKKLDPRNLRYEPRGTNLFDARQAEKMVLHLIEGLPVSAADAAEAAVGRAVYSRVAALMDATDGPELDALNLLTEIIEATEADLSDQGESHA